MTIRTDLRAALLTLSLASFVALGPLAGCAATNEATKPTAPPSIDADPLALLPRGAVAIGTLDARAFYGSGVLGAEFAMLAERLLPLGQEAGFSASRDVDRMLMAVYAVGGIDAAAVLSGRFDVQRIQAAAAAHVPPPGTAARPGSLMAVPYGGRVLYSIASFAFVPLTDHTMIAGTEAEMRRVLDRLAAGPPVREVPDWMVQTLESQGAAFAAGVDFASIPPALFQSLPLPMTWTSGLTNTRLIGNFHEPGLNVAETLTYLDPPHATTGADSLKQLGAMVGIASAMGVAPRLQNLSIAANGPSVECKFVVDEQGIRGALSSFLSWLGAGRPHA